MRKLTSMFGRFDVVYQPKIGKIGTNKVYSAVGGPPIGEESNSKFLSGQTILTHLRNWVQTS